MILMFSAYKVPIVLGYIACDMPAKSFWSSQAYLTTDGWVPILDGFLVYMWYMVGSQLSQLVVGQDVNMLYTLLVVSDIADSGSHGRKRLLDDEIDRKKHSVILPYWNPVKLPKGILLNLIIVVLLLHYAKIIPCFVATKPGLYVQELATGGAASGTAAWASRCEKTRSFIGKCSEARYRMVFTSKKVINVVLKAYLHL